MVLTEAANSLLGSMCRCHSAGHGSSWHSKGLDSISRGRVPVSSGRMRVNAHNWNMGESIYIYQKDLLYGESGQTQALESSSWRYSTAIWTLSWATGSRYPNSSRRIELDGLQRFLPTSVVL